MRVVVAALCSVILIGCGGGGGSDDQGGQSEYASLGKKIFFDPSLSSPAGQSCSTCHSPQAAFSDPTHAAVSRGAVSSIKGTRNSPTAMYSMYSPVFGFSSDEGDYVGGQFWDGRSADLEAQAKLPFFGHKEMNLADHEALRARVAQAPYAGELEGLYGQGTLSDAEATLIAVTNALAAYENSDEFRPFSSKYDAWVAGRTQLTDQERRGMDLFNAPNKGNCAACHPSVGPDGSPRHALFTDFTYDNAGVPANRAVNPSPDVGLYGITGRPSDIGRFKVPTLRNVAITAPYFHNGVTGTLKAAVHFYNARDVDPAIAPPEFPANMNTAELGNLGLTSAEEDDIVAFLNTLTDGYSAP